MNTPLIERSPSGSGMIVKTIGIDDVARPAANVSRGLVVTMTSTFALTRLAAREPQQKSLMATRALASFRSVLSFGS